MMQQLLQQWKPCMMEQCTMEQSTLQWMAYGCQPMQQYQIPIYASPPQVHFREPIEITEAKWAGLTGLPPGLGHERDQA